jgi:hypothetical protein
MGIGEPFRRNRVVVLEQLTEVEEVRVRSRPLGERQASIS